MGAQASQQHHMRVLRGGSTDVRVLTYNVCWEALEAKKFKRKCSEDQGARSFNRCTANIAELILTFLPDIILLQEIREQSDVQWKDGLHAALLHHVPSFDDLYSWTFTTGMEVAGVMTFFNKRKFTLHSVKQGDFLSERNSTSRGRPYLITAFTDGLVVANVHLPHLYEITAGPESRAEFAEELRRALYALPGVNIEDPRWQLILGGDFNLDRVSTLEGVKQELSVFQRMVPGKKLYLPPAAYDTCVGQSFDHILTSIQRIPSALYTTVPLGGEGGAEARNRMRDLVSDHAPVLATVPWLTRGARADWTDEQEAAELRRHPLPSPPRLEEVPESALYLVHYTPSNPEHWTELIRGASDGVFLTLVTDKNVDSVRTFSGMYRILLPLNFLTLPNYYINLADQYGTLDQVNTYFPWQLADAVAKINEEATLLRKLPLTDTFNEVVFPDSLQLGMLGQCWKMESLQRDGTWAPLQRTRFIVREPAACPPQSVQAPVIRIDHLPSRAPFVGLTQLSAQRGRTWTRALAAAAGQEAWARAAQFYSEDTGVYNLQALTDVTRAKLFEDRRRQRLSELHDIVEYEHALDQRHLRGRGAYAPRVIQALVDAEQAEQAQATSVSGGEPVSDAHRLALMKLLRWTENYQEPLVPAVTRWLKTVNAAELYEATFEKYPLESVLLKSVTDESLTLSLNFGLGGVFELVVMPPTALDDATFEQDVAVTRALHPFEDDQWVHVHSTPHYRAVLTLVMYFGDAWKQAFKGIPPMRLKRYEQQFRTKLAKLGVKHGRITPSTVFFDNFSGFGTSFRNSLEPQVLGEDVDNFNKLVEGVKQ